MNISHTCRACYQHIQLNDTCHLVNTPLCFDAGVTYSGFRQFKCKKSISDTC
jgi:hypothetical protein